METKKPRGKLWTGGKLWFEFEFFKIVNWSRPYTGGKFQFQIIMMVIMFLITIS
jgi:hypothetical protein